MQKEIKLKEKVQIWDQLFVEKRAVVKNEMASDKNITGVGEEQWGRGGKKNGEEQLRSEKGQGKLTQLETKPNVGDKKKEGQILKGTAVGKEQKGKKPRIS